MTPIDAQIMLAEKFLSLLPAMDREKIEIARSTLRQMVALDPFCIGVAIRMMNLELAKKETLPPI
jgi:hypothetical protein